MKKTLSILLTIQLAVVGSLSAQQRWDVGGIVLDPGAITAMDLFNYSQQSGNLGTARATAMGGAITSLGGDITSMSVNPAGLGMYRQNDVALTPMVGIAHSATGNTKAFEGNTSSRFSIADFGVVLKAYESTGKVVAVNIGFGYNRMADFNYRTSYTRYDNVSSIAGAFARQLTEGGFRTADISAGENENFSWWNIDPAYWGSVLGYKCGLVDAPYGSWQPDMFGDNPYVDHYMTLKSRGGIGEYALSTGMNIDNKLYIGFTLGIQSIRQRRDLYYGEEYYYDEGEQPAGNQLFYTNYNQTSIVDGSGVNLKFGLTYRPLEALRIGVAVHTPTWYGVDFKYQGAMMTHLRYNSELLDIVEQTEPWTDSGRDRWHFRTPAKLLLGASYTLGQKAIFSVDYERTWYNGIRTSDTPVGHGVYKQFFRNEFRGSNTVKAGVEYKPIPFIALRAGYGYSGSMVRDTATVYSSPIVYSTQYASAGLGFVLSNVFYIDLAYRYVAQKQTTGALFYAVSTDGSAGDEWSGDYRTRIERNEIIMTLGFRF